MAADHTLAQTSKARKTRKQLKRAAARARRSALEGVKPKEFWCNICGARPNDCCTSPSGKLLSGFHSTHAPRRKAAELQEARIFDSGRRARDLLTAEHSRNESPGELSLRRVRHNLDLLGSRFGPIDERYKTLIEDLYIAPNPKKWAACHGIILAPTEGFGLTLWKALLFVDPEKTPLDGPPFQLHEQPAWNWAPKSAKIEEAVAYAAHGTPHIDSEATPAQHPDHTIQTSLW